MSLIDDLHKELDETQAEHDRLKENIPKLQEKERELKEQIVELYNGITLEQEAHEKRQEVEKEALVRWKGSLDKAEQYLERRIESFEAYEKKAKAKNAEQELAIEDKKLAIKRGTLEEIEELNTKKNELNSLLDEQVRKENQLLRDLQAYQDKMTVYYIGVKDIDKKQNSLETKEKEMRKREMAVEAQESTLQEQAQKAEETTRSADASLKAARAMLSEAKERDTLVSLRVDEYERKAMLLSERETFLQKKEVALKDRTAVYDSHIK